MNKQQTHMHFGRLVGEQWLPQSYSEHADSPTWCWLDQPQDTCVRQAGVCMCVCVCVTGSVMLISVMFHNKLNGYYFYCS
jgi:hypothetical protein